MGRKQTALRLLAGLDRLQQAGLAGIWREALFFPLSLSAPVGKLAAVLHVPPLLLWVMLATLIGSAVVAVSWILTALILALTRGVETLSDVRKAQRASNHGADGNDSAGNLDDNAGGGHIREAIEPLPSDPVPEQSDDADLGEGVHESGSQQQRATALHQGNPADRTRVVAATRDTLASQSAARADGPGTSPGAVIPHPTTRHRPGQPHMQPPLPPVPYLDERQSAEVRRHVIYFSSVIPTNPFEAVRVCDELCGLRLDPRGYAALLAGTTADTGTGAGAGTTAAGGASAAGAGPRGGSGRGDGGGGGGGEEDATVELGRVALASHMVRYVHGLYDTSAAAASPSSMRRPAQTSGAGGVGEGEGSAASNPPAGGPLAPPSSSPPSASAVLSASAVYLRPEVLTAVARRLRLDLIAQLAAAQTQAPLAQAPPQHKQLEAVSGRRWLGGGASRARQAAAAAVAPPQPPSQQPALLLLRLVWAVHAADPGRCWLMVCVLAGLAHRLRLVPER